MKVFIFFVLFCLAVASASPIAPIGLVSSPGVIVSRPVGLVSSYGGSPVLLSGGVSGPILSPGVVGIKTLG